jgi:hypothetical protein
VPHADTHPDAAPNRYTVRESEEGSGWVVAIVDPAGTVVWSRPCAGEAEARTFASTVRQHVYWLTEPKFREYYRLPEPAEDGVS